MYADKAAFFNAQTTAHWADAEYGEAERPKLERLLRHLPPLPGLHILEPGCGTGRLTAQLANAVGMSGHVTALDVSAGMIERAKQRLEKHPNVTLSCCALENCPIQPASIDVALCHQVFPHIIDQRGALALMADALRPGGWLIIHHFINSETINDHHRKAGTAVADDVMPTRPEMLKMLAETRFSLHDFLDDDLGYLLTARREE